MKNNLSTVFRLSVSILLFSSLLGSGTPQTVSTNFSTQPVFAQENTVHTLSGLYEKTSPAVVTIKNGNGHGSGFLISSDGLIITNAHVLANQPRVVTVRLHDGRQMPADVIGFARGGVDLAALRIYGHSDLPTLDLSNSNSVQVGQSIYVIGTPLKEKYQNTLSTGLVNRINAHNGTLQHDANTHPGVSGAPVLNSEGQVIGVHFSGDVSSQVYSSNGNQIGYTKSGLNFAITLNRLRSFMREIENGTMSKFSTLPKQEESKDIPTIRLNGKPVQGVLSKTNPAPGLGGLIDLYKLKGKMNQKLKITLKSDDFDPILYLYRAVKKEKTINLTLVTSNKDRGPGDLNAQIDISLSETGDYMIGIGGTIRDEQGKYTIQASSISNSE